MSDENSEGIWYGSRSNRIITFTSWAPNNPDGGSEENYAVLYTQNNFDWHDRPKSYFYYPICQFLWFQKQIIKHFDNYKQKIFIDLYDLYF